MPGVIHDNSQYANNRAEQSQEATRVGERVMRGPASWKFKSTGQAQRFLGAHAAVSNLFNLYRHKVGAQHHLDLRVSAFTYWPRAVAQSSLAQYFLSRTPVRSYSAN
jgi:putative transposase